MAKSTQTKSTAWGVEFFQRHVDDDPTEAVPGRDFLDGIPEKVAARIISVLEAVAKAPPLSFAGGGYWEAMHDEMAGYYEVRVDGPQRTHHRLFCLLERDGKKVGLDGPSIVVITGMTKPFLTTFSKAEYAAVRALGDEFTARKKRNVAR